MFVAKDIFTFFCFVILAFLAKDVWSFLNENEAVVICRSKLDCPSDACCVQDSLTSHTAVCQPMSGMGSICYFRQPNVLDLNQPEDVVSTFDQCPCKFGLECFPVNGSDPVYGQIGYCVPSSP